MKEILIVSVLGFGLASCAKPPDTIVETVYVDTPVVAPIVPRVDVLTLRPIDWIVLTEDTVGAHIQKNTVLYALSVSDYENLALNISDIRANIDQYREIIRIYENSYR